MNKFDKNLRDIKPKDLIFVILYGGLLSVLLGIAFGLLDYYISSALHFSFAMLWFFLSAQFIGNMVRKQYERPHIVYTVLTGVFLVAQALLIYIMPFVYAASQIAGDITVIFDISTYYYFVIYFFQTIILNFDFNMLIIILVIGVGTYVGVRRTY